jgi:hypothetical protein
MWEAVIIAIAAAVPGIAAAIVGFLNRSKITEVHTLVNSRLDDALTELAALKQAPSTARASPSEEQRAIPYTP